MSLNAFIEAMPKVELHVHMEGSVQPELLLQLAKKNNVELPADSVEGIRKWYTFRDFSHFVEIYVAITKCIKSPEDIEHMARAFIEGQAQQNIRHTEATYTALTHYVLNGIPFDEQIDALNRARAWGKATHGVSLNLIIDIPRNLANDDQSMQTAEWAVSAQDKGVVSLGLGGAEINNPPENFVAAFDYARANGLASIPHAGETVGSESIWGAIRALGAQRIGHGVRAIEDPELMAYLREHQIPLEVNPTSNVCLSVVPDLKSHMLPKLIEGGLYVTINSDDPPMFNTTLTNEYQQTAALFSFDVDQIEGFVLNAVRVSLLPEAERAQLEADFKTQFATLRQQWLNN